MTDDDYRLLEFEDSHPKLDSGKKSTVLELFGAPIGTYYLRLFQLIEEPEVVATYPAMTRRLARLRSRQHRLSTRAEAE